MKLIICENKEEVLANFHIRYEVFIKEQGVSMEDEMDFMEDKGDMFLLQNDEGKYVSCARVIYEDSVAHLGRVATLKEERNKKYASIMISKIEEYLSIKGIKEVYLGAQIQAKDFYKNIGYTEYGDVFYDANILHIHMRKEI